MKKACVIGWPIKHSRSPLIHNHWLMRHGIEGVYEKVAVEPDELDRFLRAMPDAGWLGCNVTVPHKEKVFELVRSDDPFTQRLGAVNTVYIRGGQLHGTNTDGIGFMRNLQAAAPQWQPASGPVVVLGAGGAARAVVAALIDAGVPEVRIVNRTRDRAAALAELLGNGAKARDWTMRGDLLADCTLLVNTTTLGMAGAPPLDLELDRLAPEAVVYDIVYVPLETDLLARARARGNPTVDGLGMLLHQAAPAFALWFGFEPEVTDELRDLIVADLEQA